MEDDACACGDPDCFEPIEFGPEVVTQCYELLKASDTVIPLASTNVAAQQFQDHCIRASAACQNALAAFPADKHSNALESGRLGSAVAQSPPGTQHDKMLAVRCVLQQHELGAATQLYTGSISPCRQDLWAGGAWESHCTAEQLQQGVRVDTSVTHLRSSRLELLSGTPDALLVSPDSRVCCLKVVCLQSPVPAVEYLFGSSSRRPNLSCLCELLQLRFLLGPASDDVMEFATWWPGHAESESESESGHCSIIRLRVTQDDFITYAVPSLWPLIAHYHLPTKEWCDTNNMPAEGDLVTRVTRFSSGSKGSYAFCQCGGDRICLAECHLQGEGTCTCRCVAHCLQPSQHASSCQCALSQWRAAAAAAAAAPAAASHQPAALPVGLLGMPAGQQTASAAAGASSTRRGQPRARHFSRQQEGILEATWRQNFEEFCWSMFVSGTVALYSRQQLLWQLSDEGVVAGCTVDEARVQQWFRQQYNRHQAEMAWEPDDVQLQVLTGLFGTNGFAAGYRSCWGAAALMHLQYHGVWTDDVTECDIMSWYLQQQQQAGHADAPFGCGGSDGGDGGGWGSQGTGAGSASEGEQSTLWYTRPGGEEAVGVVREACRLLQRRKADPYSASTGAEVLRFMMRPPADVSDEQRARFRRVVKDYRLNADNLSDVVRKADEFDMAMYNMPSLQCLAGMDASR